MHSISTKKYNCLFLNLVKLQFTSLMQNFSKIAERKGRCTLTLDSLSLSCYMEYTKWRYKHINKCKIVVKLYYIITFFRNSVRLAIRKIMYAPSKQGEQPSVEVSKEFMMSPNKLYLEASLDKVNLMKLLLFHLVTRCKKYEHSNRTLEDSI